MNIDVEFLLKSVHARNEIVNWLLNRPSVGLDVTDVAMLCDGFDYLGKVLAEVTGKDLKELTQLKIEGNIWNY